MTRERHAQVKKIFLEACALTADKQGEHLARACAGDEDLRREVERLLANHIQGAGPNGGVVELASAPSSTEQLPSYQTGQMVAGRYRIVALLGIGGMGEVYRAEDMTLRKTVALKFLPAELASNSLLRRRLEMEVKLAREITHSNVCRVHDIGEDKGTPFISMEYVDGENLSAMLKRTGRLSGPRVVEIAQQLCFGLSAAHARGVLHRDLKPANVMLDDRGRVRITDFGLAGVAGQIHPAEIRSGTPRYMAPEQLAGRGVSERSDIYSLGLILYELVCGQAALGAASTAELLREHHDASVTSPSEIVRDIDPALDAVILACLEKDPARRPESALEAAAALPGGDVLAAALAAGDVPSPALLALAGSRQAIVKPRLVAALAGCVLLLVVALVAARRVHPVFLGDAIAPDLLESAGLRLIADAGYSARPIDVVGRYAERSEYSLRERGATASYELGAVSSARPLYFLRVSFRGRIVGQNPVSPFMSSAGGVFSVDEREADTILTAFEPDGKLVLFDASMILPKWSTTRSGGEGRLGGDEWFARCGLRLSAFHTVVPMLSNSALGEDGTGLEANADSGLSGSTRVEASSGGMHFFAVMTERSSEEGLIGLNVAQRRSLLTACRNVLFLVLLIASIPAAWMNWWHGGSDAAGAIRIGIFIGLLRLCANLLTARHVPHLPDEISLLTMGVFNSLAEGLMAAIFYLALERYVRRVWPQTLAGWSRVLRGRVRDPLVGREILLGCMVGLLWAALGSFEYLLPGWLGWRPRASLRFMDEFQYLMGTRFGAAFCCDWMINAIYVGLLLLMLLVILRVVVRVERVAAVTAWFVVSLLYVPAGRHPLTGWLVIGLGGIAVAVFILVRFGLVSFVVAAFINKLVMSFPFTMDLASWYAGYGIFAATLALGIALFGFVQASRSLRPGSAIAVR